MSLYINAILAVVFQFGAFLTMFHFVWTNSPKHAMLIAGFSALSYLGMFLSKRELLRKEKEMAARFERSMSVDEENNVRTLTGNN